MMMSPLSLDPIPLCLLAMMLHRVLPSSPGKYHNLDDQPCLKLLRSKFEVSHFHLRVPTLSTKITAQHNL